MLDRLINRKQAARIAGVSHLTIWRWMTKGILDSLGNRVRLRRTRRGRQLYTTEAWLNEFFAALDAADDARASSESVVADPPMPKPELREDDDDDILRRFGCDVA